MIRNSCTLSLCAYSLNSPTNTWDRKFPIKSGELQHEQETAKLLTGNENIQYFHLLLLLLHFPLSVRKQVQTRTASKSCQKGNLGTSFFLCHAGKLSRHNWSSTILLRSPICYLLRCNSIFPREYAMCQLCPVIVIIRDEISKADDSPQNKDNWIKPINEWRP
jgi:hypothetical protein